MGGLKFAMNQVVALSSSKETGTIIARAEYAHAEPSYLLRYTAADGRAVENWWSESAIEAL